MAFKQLDSKYFTNNLSLAASIKDDLELLGFTVYKYERLNDEESLDAHADGVQIYANFGDELFINFRTVGKGKDPARRSSKTGDLGVLAARPSDGLSEDDFYTSAPAEGIPRQYVVYAAAFDDMSPTEYKLYYKIDADQMVFLIQLEIQPGIYNYICFGKARRERTDTQFVTSSLAYESSFTVSNVEKSTRPLFCPANTSDYNTLCTKLTYKTKDRWLVPGDLASSVSKVTSNYVKAPCFDIGDEYFQRSASSLTGITAFLPVTMFVIEEDISHKIFQFDDLYIVNMLNLQHNEKIHYGQDEYIVLTSLQKDNPPSYSENRGNAGVVLKLEPQE